MRMKCVIGEGVLRGMIRVGLMESILERRGGKKYGSVMEFLKETKDKLNAMEDPKEFGKYLYRIFNEYIDYHTSQGENKSWKLRDAIRVILGSFNLFNTDEESEKTNRVRLSKVFGIKGKAD